MATAGYGPGARSRHLSDATPCFRCLNQCHGPLGPGATRSHQVPRAEGRGPGAERLVPSAWCRVPSTREPRAGCRGPGAAHHAPGAEGRGPSAREPSTREPSTREPSARAGSRAPGAEHHAPRTTHQGAEGRAVRFMPRAARRVSPGFTLNCRRIERSE